MFFETSDYLRPLHTFIQERGVKIMAQRTTGEVKWFSRQKGYGFIRPEDGEDVFVHHSGIRGIGFKNLEEGERVEFIVQTSPKGPHATDVVQLEDSSRPSYRTIW